MKYNLDIDKIREFSRGFSSLDYTSIQNDELLREVLKATFLWQDPIILPLSKREHNNPIFITKDRYCFGKWIEQDYLWGKKMIVTDFLLKKDEKRFLIRLFGIDII